MSNRSSSNLFRTAFAENLRRFWPVALASALLLFFGGPYIAIADRYSSDYEWTHMLANENVMFMLVHMFIPIATAVSLFKYLHTPGSVAVMNALPLSRARLFRVNFFSGVLLWFAPLLVNALIMMVIEPVVARSVLGWLLTSFVIEAAVYALSVFSCCVTGTVIHSFLGSFLFNGLVSVLLLILYAYEQQFIWGLMNTNTTLYHIAMIHPYSAVVADAFIGEGANPYYLAWYFALIAIVSTVSFFLYKSRKMERAGDALAFRGFEPVLSVLIAFIGMSGIAFLFLLRNDTKSDFIVGCVIGLPIAWIVGRMLVMKTIRIFRKKDFLNLAVAAVCSALVVWGFMGDFFGIENYVPKDASVNSVKIDYYTANGALYDYSLVSSDMPSFSDPENIKNVTGLHRAILARKDELKSYEHRGYDYDWRSVSFRYDRTGLDTARSYNVPAEILETLPEMKALFESPENKAALLTEAQEESLLRSITTERNPDPRFLSKQITVNSVLGTVGGNVLVTKEADIRRLQAAMDKDWLNLTYEEALKDELPLAIIETTYTYALPDDYTSYSTVQSRPSGQSQRSTAFRILPCCRETIAVLRSLGIWDTVALSADKVVKASVYRYDYSMNRNASGEVYYDEYGNAYYSREDYERYAYAADRNAAPLPTSYKHTISQEKESAFDELVAEYDAETDAARINALIARGYASPVAYDVYDYVILTFRTGEHTVDSGTTGNEVLSFYKFFLRD